MTLNGHYALLNSHYALYYITCLSFGARHKNLNEDRPTMSAAEMLSGECSF